MIASRVDEAAAALVAGLGDAARLLTPADLSEPGWSLTCPPDGRSTAVVGGERVPEREIGAVITLLPAVFAAELVHIHPEDREYVAAEATAFLQCWLAGLRCPRLNPPSAGSLSGPVRSARGWSAVAAEVGIPVGSPDAGDAVEVSTVGQDVVGSADPVLAERARRLARHARLTLARLTFTGADPALARVSCFPDVADPDVQAALHRRLVAA